MGKLKRTFLQALLWLALWAVLWLVQGNGASFLADNGMAIVFQLALIVGLVFYAAPKLLFKRKYTWFAGLSIVLIVVLAFVSSELFSSAPPRPMLRRPPPPMRGGPMLNERPAIKIPSRFFIHLLLLSISFVLATFWETFLFAKKKEEETIRNKNENLQTELKLLKSQINPHFLFNSLNNIYALSVIDSDKTQQSISILSDMLRYVLYECEQPLVRLEKEVTYIENYIKLFSLKSSKPYPITTDFNILNPKAVIAPMLFIPFIENALKHGHIEKITDTFIHIKIYADSREIQFEIENSVPKQAINKDKVGGIGIENVKKRLAILYPEKHQLSIDANNTSYKVSLNLKLNAND